MRRLAKRVLSCVVLVAAVSAATPSAEAYCLDCRSIDHCGMTTDGYNHCGLDCGAWGCQCISWGTICGPG